MAPSPSQWHHHHPNSTITFPIVPCITIPIVPSPSPFLFYYSHNHVPVCMHYAVTWPFKAKELPKYGSRSYHNTGSIHCIHIMYMESVLLHRSHYKHYSITVSQFQGCLSVLISNDTDWTPTPNIVKPVSLLCVIITHPVGPFGYYRAGLYIMFALKLSKIDSLYIYTPNPCICRPYIYTHISMYIPYIIFTGL